MYIIVEGCFDFRKLTVKKGGLVTRGGRGGGEKEEAQCDGEHLLNFRHLV